MSNPHRSHNRKVKSIITVIRNLDWSTVEPLIINRCKSKQGRLSIRSALDHSLFPGQYKLRTIRILIKAAFLSDCLICRGPIDRFGKQPDYALMCGACRMPANPDAKVILVANYFS